MTAWDGKLLLVWSAFLLPGIGMGGCNSAEKYVPGPRTPPSEAGYVFNDADDDDHGLHATNGDKDDVLTRAYGHEGSSGQRAGVMPVLARYFAAAARGNGAEACEALSQRLASSTNLEASLPNDYRPAAGSSVFHNKDCAQTESLLFELNRHQLQIESSSLQVASIRLSGNRALAIMCFKAIGERQIALLQEGDRWSVDGLIDESLP
jgi:hypothetical protein